MPSFRFTACAFALAFFLGASPAQAAPVFMEKMTWMEIRDRVHKGDDVVIVPIGGIEQNGPHLVTGKHNLIVRYTAGEIAKRLGNALVASVVAHAPEGRISPPEGHMQFPGTLSVSEETFSALLEDITRSLKQNGFKTICYIGDHGGSQSVQARLATKLSDEWEGQGVRVIQVSNYYSNNGQQAWAQSVGIKTPHIGAHAGFADTSELMAVDSGAVREDKLGPRGDNDYKATGAAGDSSQANANQGRRLLSLKIEAALDQIQSRLARNP